MEATTELKVLRISSDPSVDRHIFTQKVPLINVGSGGISEDKCKTFEKELGHIPDMDSFNTPDAKTFSRDHGTLFTYPDQQDTYMMYVCQDADAGLPHNGYLEERFKDIHKAPRAPLMPKVVVYGDVCVFKMKTESGKPQKTKSGEPQKTESGEPQKASYIDMNQDFAEKAGWEFGSAYVILRNLLTVSPGKD